MVLPAKLRLLALAALYAGSASLLLIAAALSVYVVNEAESITPWGWVVLAWSIGVALWMGAASPWLAALWYQRRPPA